MRLIAAGLSFHSAPLALRERAVITQAEAPALLRYLVGPAGLSGAAVLSTCNRTEFYVTCTGDDLAGQVADKLSRYLDPGNAEIGDHLEVWRDGEAVRHICSVAAGLDSMVLGEVQVLGQLRDAHRVAADAGTLGPELDDVIRGAIVAGKRVRSETRIAYGTHSLSEVAVTAAAGHVSTLQGTEVLLIGAGAMNMRAARRLADLGAVLTVTSRGESAVSLAAEVGGRHLPLGELGEAIDPIDVVISSTSAPGAVVTARDVGMWQARRHGRPLVIIDLAVPRDVEPAAAGVPGVTVVDIDQLGKAIRDTEEARRSEMPEAERIVEAEVDTIMRRLGERVTAVPTIVELVGRAEALRAQELERSRARLGDLDPATLDAIDQLTQSIVRKVLHAPIGHLREHAADAEEVRRVRRAFGLERGGRAATDAADANL